MAKVYLDEINAFLESSTLDTLTKDSEESGSSSNALESFVNGSSKELNGKQWETYRGSFASFNAALQARTALAQKLGEAISKALKLLQEYLGTDQMLDSSKLDEYKRQRQTCLNSIDKLNQMLTATKQVEVAGENGTKKLVSVAMYDVSEVRAQITQANETLTELDRLIEKIEGLDEVYKQAEAILQEAFTGIDVFKNQVSGITPDRKVSYKRV